MLTENNRATIMRTVGYAPPPQKPAFNRQNNRPMQGYNISSLQEVQGPVLLIALESEIMVVHTDQAGWEVRTTFPLAVQHLPYGNPPSVLRVIDKSPISYIKDAYQALVLASSLKFAAVLSEADFMARISEVQLDPDLFRSGFLATKAHQWEAYFEVAGIADTKLAKRIKLQVREGVRFDFVSVYSPSQQSHPRFQQRLNRVEKLLARTIGPDIVEAYLNAPYPQPVHFSNNRSLTTHVEFAREAVDKLVKNGVLVPWDFESMGLPTVVNAMGVAYNRHGKKRLCIDPCYVNLFLPYKPVHYEGIDDVLGYIEKEMFLLGTDKRSGYHVQGMHSSTYRFLAVLFDAEYFFCSALPFGVSTACEKYTELMKPVYLPWRNLGQLMTAMIDDAQFAMCDLGVAQQLMIAYVTIESHLGFFYSNEKCCFFPSFQNKFLGIIVDTSACALFVPQNKLDAFVKEATLALQEPDISSRVAAQLAGQIVSFYPAIQYAPLFVRELFAAIQHVAADWDAKYTTSPGFSRELSFLVKNINTLNGKVWAFPTQAIILVGDASAKAYAGFTPNGEIPDNIVIPFSPGEVRLMQMGQFSSCLREVRCARLLIEYVLRYPRLYKGKRILYIGDNEGGISALKNMRGQSDIFDEVKSVHLQALEQKVFLDFEWRPRETDWLVYADKLSKIVDSSELFISDVVFDRIRLSFGLSTFGLDPFAGIHPGQHRASEFCTLHATPGSIKVNGLAHCWRGKLSWIFPPTNLIPQVLRKVSNEKVECVLFLPDFKAPWIATLRNLPIVKNFKCKYFPGLYTLGPRVPADRHTNPPRYSWTAFYVKFE